MAQIRLPEKLADLFSAPRGSVAYRGMYGGRGSAKSYSAALMAALLGYQDQLRILCTREYQVSIRESFHAELRGAIEAHPWLAHHYEIGAEYIRGRNATEFIFRGLARNHNSIKSLAGIDVTIVEEAEDVPESSWLVLEATVFRRPGSELWAIWNPKLEGSPVDKRFRQQPPPNAAITSVNWQDNPFFPRGLSDLRKRQQQNLDPNTYAWIWEGAYLTNSDAQVFGGKWRVAGFEPGSDWDGPYQGGDFGFSQDPTAVVRCWVHDSRLWVEREAGARELVPPDTPAFVERRIPGYGSYVSRWDSSRPESVEMLRRAGYHRAESVKKWAGSIEDGIAFMRSFREIIVHPRCTATAEEMRTYNYKVDRQTGDVLPDIVDACNHYIDAIRYALAPMIRQRNMAGMVLPIRKALHGHR